MNADYASLSGTYDTYRRPDPRLARALADALGPIASAVDVGAGTGKYARALAEEGLHVTAVEPSDEMRARAAAHPRVKYRAGRAEALPLGDGAVDAAFAVLATSHVADLEGALREMDRVTGRGTIVDVVVDPRAAEPHWFAAYFPAVHARNLERSEPVADRVARVERTLGRPAQAHVFAVPADFVDAFAGACWRRPALCLEPAYRASSSSFARVDPHVIDACVSTLERDLASGRFAAQHGWIEERSELDVGLRLVVAHRRGR